MMVKEGPRRHPFTNSALPSTKATHLPCTPILHTLSIFSKSTLIHTWGSSVSALLSSTAVFRLANEAIQGGSEVSLLLASFRAWRLPACSLT